MRAVRISEDFIPISEFKAQAADILRKIGETGAPIVVTQNGKPAAVLLSPRAFARRRVPELGRDDIREVLVRSYRLVYRVANRMEVLAVFHGQRLFPHDVDVPPDRDGE